MMTLHVEEVGSLAHWRTGAELELEQRFSASLVTTPRQSTD